MTKNVANEYACFRIGKRQNAKKITAHLLGWLVVVGEAEPTFLRSQARWETRKILGKKYLLNVARHFEVGFKLRIFNPQFFRVADEILFGLLSRFLRGFAPGDVLHHALVVQELAGHLIMDS